MTFEESLKHHLLEYKKAKGKNQEEMADLLDIGVRTYQTIETTGDVIKAKDLRNIIEKTGFAYPQNFAFSGTSANVSGDEDFFASKDVVFAMRAVLKVLTQKLIKSEVKETRKDEQTVSKEFRKAMQTEYEQLLGGLQKS